MKIEPRYFATNSWYHLWPLCPLSEMGNISFEMLKELGFEETTLEEVKRKGLRAAVCTTIAFKEVYKELGGVNASRPNEASTDKPIQG